MAASRESSAADIPLPFLWEVHRYINEYIRFADTKAAFLMTAASAIVGALVSTGVVDKIFTKSAPTAWSFTTWLALTGLAFLTASVSCGVFAIKPRLWGRATVGLIFWESILRHGTSDMYHAALVSASSGREKAISDHIYVLSALAQRKYDFVKFSVYLAIPGGLLAGMSIFLHHAHG